jgi:hypothetical protein
MGERRRLNRRGHRGQSVGSPLLSAEWKSVQPVGRKRIAQRFIAGIQSPRAKSRRDDRSILLEGEGAKMDFFRPYEGAFFVLGSCPAMNRWAIFARPSGAANREFVLPGPGPDWRPPQSFPSKTGPLGILRQPLSESQTTCHHQRTDKPTYPI